MLLDEIKLNENGFLIIDKVLDTSSISERLKNCQNNLRNVLNQFPEIKNLAETELLNKFIQPILGSKARIIRSIFFNKTNQFNWKVPLHQDLTIAVKEKFSVVGYANWSLKEGIIHVQPPQEILENMLTLRIHLDHCKTASEKYRTYSKISA